MIKKLLAVLCLCILHAQDAGAQHQYTAHSARFGKHTRRLHTPPANVVRIFMDGEGSYYPGIYISDKDLYRHNSSLGQWYRGNAGVFDTLCAQYRVAPGIFEQRLDGLNTAIAQNIVTEVNAKSSGYDAVNVSIHGFSKKAYGCRVVDRHATGDNRKLEHALYAKTTKKLFFIEIYWDSKFINVLSGARKARGYYIFRDGGLPNAMHVGLSLRKVIANVHVPQLNVITHSLGAAVACELLFDADTANPPQQAIIPVPQQPHIKMCLVAPAIGANLFNNYFLRTGNTITPRTDNYLCAVVYNTNDIVLNKNVSFLGIHFVNHTAADIAPTTLGCNYHNDISVLQSKIAPGTARTFDLSLKRRQKHKCHYLNNCYICNRARFSDVVSYLNE